MKWEQKTKPDLGDVRVIKQFLFFPKCLPVCGLTDTMTWRWLENVTVKQVFKRVSEQTAGYDFADSTDEIDEWVDFAWMEI
jgi:hypothetical protein